VALERARDHRERNGTKPFAFLKESTRVIVLNPEE